MLPIALLGLFLAVPTWAGAATPVLVQGTTDIRDAGLLADVIEPGFHAAYPEYELKYLAFGTGQAIANAKAGQGDALVVHAPSQERTFVEEGYSLEPRGRAIFYSDYVIPGPLDDPAEALAKAPHNAALAYELIAKAGAEGKANFVSRGDKSGTNTQELAIWKLTKVELNKLGEPGPAGTETDASWYHKAGQGQAETVLLTQQCPFSGGGCYEMTDRGTYNRLVANGSVTELQIVTQDNEASAPGGQNLLTNPFSFYAVNPAKLPGVDINVAGAKALMTYLTSEAFQAGLASYPNTTAPAFFEDARPKLTTSSITGVFDAGAKFTLDGGIVSRLPGAQAVSGVPVNVQEAPFGQPSNYTTIASGTTDAAGNWSVQATADRPGTLRIEMPDTGAAYPSLGVTPLISSGGLTQTFAPAGQIDSVRGAATPQGPLKAGNVGVRKPTRQGRVVTLRGLLSPAVTPSTSAVLVVQGRKLGTKQKFHALKKVRAREGVAYTLRVKLKAGRWKLRVRYQDPGAIAAPVASRAVSVSVR